MQIQVNTDDHITGREELVERIEAQVGESLARFDGHITRVEVHLADETGGKPVGDDKRCIIEARPAGQQAVAVTHHGPTLHAACSGATQKLKHLLDSRFGRQADRHRGESIRTADPS